MGRNGPAVASKVDPRIAITFFCSNYSEETIFDCFYFGLVRSGCFSGNEAKVILPTSGKVGCHRWKLSREQKALSFLVNLAEATSDIPSGMHSAGADLD
jgi:hypothetical protein